MATELKKCKHCGKYMLIKANTCLNCGKREDQKTTKQKIVISFVVAFSIFAFINYTPSLLNWLEATSHKVSSVSVKWQNNMPIQEKNSEKILDVVIEPGDFRNVKWGMSKEEVVQVETECDLWESDNEERLNGVVEISTLDAYLAYYFDDDKLTHASYLFTETHINPNLYITDYNRLKRALINKYGEPQTDEELWFGSLYKGMESYYGTAVMIGELAFTSSWQTETTDIKLALSGDNFKAAVFMYYRDINNELVDDDFGL